MYRLHCENLREIEAALDLVQRDLRRYIKQDEPKKEQIYTKLFSHLMTCWVEVRILKVIYEPQAFTGDEIASVLATDSLEDKWKLALSIAFCKAYRIGNKKKIEQNLPFTPKARFKALMELITTDLLSSAQIRNRIAHGQWKYAFTNDLKKISGPLTNLLKKENIVTLQLKKQMFVTLATIINDLAVSPPTFERNFDVNYKKLEQQRNNFHNRDYEKYKNHEHIKYQRGLIKRNNA